MKDYMIGDCRDCGKPVMKSELDAGILHVVDGSDFTMYHHKECLEVADKRREAEREAKAVAFQERMRKAKEEHADFFKEFYDEVDAAHDYEAVESVRRNIRFKTMMELEKMRESGVFDKVQSFRDASELVVRYAKEKASKMAPKVEKSANAIDFMDALEIGSREAERYADC